jgi:charged multivesicular body protein 3
MSEMVDETMDMMDEDAEELDDEAEAEVDKVLFEITNGKMGDMSKVGSIPVCSAVFVHKRPKLMGSSDDCAGPRRGRRSGDYAKTAGCITERLGMQCPRAHL